MLTKLFRDFFESEKTGGLLLLLFTFVSLLLANSRLGPAYIHFWHTTLGGHSMEFWINDGLMTLFFLLVGLEIEREVYVGELSDPKKATLPIAAAIGGMLLPALIHFVFNHGTASQNGIGIPMATDIAFSLGVLSLLGKRVPNALKIFLTALAIIDDLGAIVVIALFYSSGFSLPYFGAALGLFVLLLGLNRLRVHLLAPYFLLGAFMWYCMFRSGIHPSITGVLLAFAIPFGDGKESSASYRLQHRLHPLVAYIILPVFALANTGIILPENWLQDLMSANSLGIMTGLVVGKPLGIVLFSVIAVKAGWCVLPGEIRQKHLAGAGMLAGIGFTMSVFITLLAFDNETLIISSKIAVFLASLVSGIIGYIALKYSA